MINLTEQEIMKDWKSTGTKPFLSICGITYNHEAYIEEAIDSFLSQKTNFSFEIVFSDDKSPDSTQLILQKYIDKYPNIMNVNLRKVNVGSMNNFVSNLKRAEGKYIAICEGDDFWCDDRKIQKQVNFLEQNDSYSGCFHDSMNYKEDMNGNIEETIRVGIRKIETKVDLDSIIYENNIATASIMYRNILTVYPEYLLKTTKGDYALMVMIAEHGYIGYIPEVMSKYRIHAGGVWSLKPKSYQINEAVKFYKLLQKHFISNTQTLKSIKIKLKSEYFYLALTLLDENKIIKSLTYLVSSISLFSVKHKIISYIRYWKVFVRVIIGADKIKYLKNLRNAS